MTGANPEPVYDQEKQGISRHGGFLRQKPACERRRDGENF